MGLLILTFLGATFGWLATIVAEIDGLNGTLTNIVAGAAGAVLIGEAVDPRPALSGLTVTALSLAVVGALLFIAVANLIRARA